MSKAQNNTNPGTNTQITCENDVVLTAYGPVSSEYYDEREFVDDVFGSDERIDIDLYEEETETNERVELNINIEEMVDRGFGDEEVLVEETISPFKSSEKEALRKHFADAELPEYMEFVDKTTTSTCFVYSAVDPIKTIAADITPSDVIESYGFEKSEYTVYAVSWNREIENNAIDADPDATIDQRCTVTAGYSSDIKPRQVLRPSDERSKGDIYQSGDERWSFQITTHFEAISGDELSAIADSVIPTLQRELCALEQIDSVRVKKCEKQVEQEGACYEL